VLLAAVPLVTVALYHSDMHRLLLFTTSPHDELEKIAQEDSSKAPRDKTRTFKILKFKKAQKFLSATAQLFEGLHTLFPDKQGVATGIICVWCAPGPPPPLPEKKTA
jgi:hypothetical protein